VAAFVQSAAVRDNRRVIFAMMPYGRWDRWSRWNSGSEGVEPRPRTSKRALADEPRFVSEEGQERRGRRGGLLNYGQRGRGPVCGNASTHAVGGLVIEDTRWTPLCLGIRHRRSRTMPATQFQHEMGGTAGLVKFDFLGSQDPTVHH